MAKPARLGAALKEIRLILCQTSEPSNGARQFVSKYYSELKSANPRLPILVRECEGVAPKLFCRFERAREVGVDLSNLTADEILARLSKVAA